ncbi:hypothetical protein FACS189425_00230 [Clostridia bacterium]|nr:hypothetical protein FACS189425_00230 [Clostridia bacterium]
MKKTRIKIPTEANIRNSGYSWIIKITFYAFIISLAFTFVASGVIPHIPIWLQVVILLLFIMINVIFDTIGTAVAAASQTPFHSMSTRQVSGAKRALYLIQNGEKVSNFCNDVIGDICGIVSGTSGAFLVISLIKNYPFHELYTSLILTGIIASLTIAGKAAGKTFALKNSNQIVYQFALLLCIFKRES